MSLQREFTDDQQLQIPAARRRNARCRDNSLAIPFELPEVCQLDKQPSIPQQTSEHLAYVHLQTGTNRMQVSQRVADNSDAWKEEGHLAQFALVRVGVIGPAIQSLLRDTGVQCQANLGVFE